MNKKVLLFAPQGFEDIEIAAFTDIFGWTRVLKEVKAVDLVITAFKKNIRSKHNLTIRAHQRIKEINPDHYQALVIPGGFSDAGYGEVYNQSVLALIRKIYNNGGVITAMCVGSLAVARAGILKDKKATTYCASSRHDNLAMLRSCGVIPVKERIVVTDRIITNRGPDTAIEVAFRLLEMLNGKRDMKKVRRAMMFE